MDEKRGLAAVAGARALLKIVAAFIDSLKDGETSERSVLFSIEACWCRALTRDQKG